MTILQRHILGNYFYDIDFDSLPERDENILSYSMLNIYTKLNFNYTLILRNERNKKMIEKYRYHNGKLFLTYFLISLFLPLTLLLVGIISGHIGLKY